MPSNGPQNIVTLASAGILAHLPIDRLMDLIETSMNDDGRVETLILARREVEIRTLARLPLANFDEPFASVVD